jgi:hypothetical protein
MDIDFTDNSNDEYYLDTSGNGNHVIKLDPTDIEDLTHFHVPG